jgi:hypothetical protein
MTKTTDHLLQSSIKFEQMIINTKEVNDLTVRQELNLLQNVKSTLEDAGLQLGVRTRFTELSQRINAAIEEAASEIIAADDYLNERA